MRCQHHRQRVEESDVVNDQRIPRVEDLIQSPELAFEVVENVLLQPVIVKFTPEPWFRNKPVQLFKQRHCFFWCPAIERQVLRYLVFFGYLGIFGFPLIVVQEPRA